MNKKKLDSALDEIAHIRSRYVADRSAFVAGATMVDLLGALGATEADMDELNAVTDRLPKDPTLPFRLTRSGRFCYSPGKSRVHRGEFQPFILTAAENFVRHDSGMVRRFAEVDGDLQSNTVLHALLVFNHLIFEGVETSARPNLDYDREEWISTLFHVRTITTPDLVGEPALEGVHSDGADHTVTTFIGGENLGDDSAVTFLHDIREKNGTRSDQVDPALTLGSHQHRDFLDTLLVVDHERKHSLSPVVARDPRKEATRDMLIFFTRKPVTVDHVSHPYDSLAPHIETPMELDLSQYVEGRSER